MFGRYFADRSLAYHRGIDDRSSTVGRPHILFFTGGVWGIGRLAVPSEQQSSTSSLVHYMYSLVLAV